MCRQRTTSLEDAVVKNPPGVVAAHRGWCATYEIQAIKNIGRMHANGKQQRGRYIMSDKHAWAEKTRLNCVRRSKSEEEREREEEKGEMEKGKRNEHLLHRTFPHSGRNISRPREMNHSYRLPAVGDFTLYFPPLYFHPHFISHFSAHSPCV